MHTHTHSYTDSRDTLHHTRTNVIHTNTVKPSITCSYLRKPPNLRPLLPSPRPRRTPRAKAVEGRRRRLTPQHVRKPQTPTRTIVVMGTNTTSKIKLEFSTPLRGHNKMRSTNNIIRKPKKSSHLPLSNPTPPMHRVKQCQPPQRKTTHKLILRLERHPKLSRSQPKIYHLQVMAPNNQLLLTLLINKTKQWKRLAQFKQILLPL